MLTKDEVKHIAKLARLEFTDVEIELFQKQLSDILDYVNTLSEVNTDNIEPTAQVVGDIHNRFQEQPNDDQKLTNEQVLKNAKDTKDGYVLTKAVL